MAGRPEDSDVQGERNGADAAAPPGAAVGRRSRAPWRSRSALPPHQRKRRKLATRGARAAGLLCVGAIGYSVGEALTYPGDDSTEARLAGWAREHMLGAVVD